MSKYFQFDNCINTLQKDSTLSIYSIFYPSNFNKSYRQKFEEEYEVLDEDFDNSKI